VISVAEQLSSLRNTLGSLLGIFTLLRWARNLLAKLTGRPLPATSTDLTPSAFAAFEGRTLPDGSTAPRPSKKPFLVFALAAFGLPYLMRKFIKAIAQTQEEEEQRRRLAGLGPNGEPLPPTQQQALDPSKLDFCRVIYDFTPEAGVSGTDLAVKKGDLVAVLSKTDSFGSPSEWWRCRARDGRVGYLPCTFLEGIQRGSGGTASGASSRTASLVGQGDKKAFQAKSGDVVALEGFQKNQFHP
jgi:peroxin-13